MKNLLFVLLILRFSCPMAQHTFTLSELENLLKVSSSDFETHVSNKGYSFSTRNGQSSCYLKDKEVVSETKDRICRIRNRPAPVIAFFTTTDKNYYIYAKK